MSRDELVSAQSVALTLCQPIQARLEGESHHPAELVPTGSLFERYGKPLNTPGLESNLGTDYDVMFAFHKTDLQLEHIMKNDEFLHFFVLSNSCQLLNQLMVFDESAQFMKLSAAQARQYMRDIVDSTPQLQPSCMKTFMQNLAPFLFNLPRFSK